MDFFIKQWELFLPHIGKYSFYLFDFIAIFLGLFFIGLTILTWVGVSNVSDGEKIQKVVDFKKLKTTAFNITLFVFVSNLILNYHTGMDVKYFNSHSFYLENKDKPGASYLFEIIFTLQTLYFFFFFYFIINPSKYIFEEQRKKISKTPENNSIVKQLILLVFAVVFIYKKSEIVSYLKDVYDNPNVLFEYFTISVLVAIVVIYTLIEKINKSVQEKFETTIHSWGKLAWSLIGLFFISFCFNFNYLVNFSYYKEGFSLNFAHIVILLLASAVFYLILYLSEIVQLILDKSTNDSNLNKLITIFGLLIAFLAIFLS